MMAKRSGGTIVFPKLLDGRGVNSGLLMASACRESASVDLLCSSSLDETPAIGG